MEVCAHAVNSLAGGVNKHGYMSRFVNDVKLDVVASSAGDEGTDHIPSTLVAYDDILLVEHVMQISQIYGFISVLNA